MKVVELASALRGETLRECAQALLELLEGTSAEPVGMKGAGAATEFAEAAVRRRQAAEEFGAAFARERDFLQGSAAGRAQIGTADGLHNLDAAARGKRGEVPMPLRAGAGAMAAAAGAAEAECDDGTGTLPERGNGGIGAMTSAELEDIDRFFRRDSRRYDSGF